MDFQFFNGNFRPIIVEKIFIKELPINYIINLSQSRLDPPYELDLVRLHHVFRLCRCKHPATKIGFGYNENVFDWKQLVWYTALHQPIADFFVVNFEFGDTVGVTESFGLFERRLKRLYERNIEFLTFLGSRVGLNWTDESLGKIVVNYPVPQSIGGESHRRLLLEYQTKLSGEGSNIGNWASVIQAPYFEHLNSNAFKVTTFLQPQPENGCNETSNQIMDFMRFKLSGISALSLKFDELLLSTGMI